MTTLSRNPVTRITRDEIKAKLKRGDKFVLVEALPEQYYRKTHLPGAINLPLEEIDRHALHLLPDKSQEIVVYCANTQCQSSTAAAQRLIELGYTRVREYVEGKQDWIDAGFPTEGIEQRAVQA